MTLTNCYVTLLQFKDHLDIDETQNDLDDAAERAISAACRAIDEMCEQRFYVDGTTSTITYQATNPCRLWVQPISTTTGLVVKTDEAGNGTYDTTWTETTDFVAKADTRSGSPYTRLLAVGSRWFPTYGNRDRVQVTAKHGWTAVPDEVVQATLIKAARLFRRKDSPEGVAGGFEFGAVRISKYEDPDVCQLLQPFMRPTALFA